MMTLNPVSILFGMIVGFSLGLTGGGGAIFAVPLLVYGLHVAPQEAVAVSLAAVGATAFVGFVSRLRQGQVEVPTGLLFSTAGMIGAPGGAWLAGRVSDVMLLTAFSVLMVFVAARMWRKATHVEEPLCVPLDHCAGDSGPTCRRDPEGRLHWTSRCAVLLMLVGLATGVLSGLFGVGGGFVIVPALIAFTGMGIRRAIGTSLLAIALVSTSGVVSHLLGGRTFPLELTLLFAVGGVAGVSLGQLIAKRLSGPMLQKTFSIAILLVAGFVISQTFLT